MADCQKVDYERADSKNQIVNNQQQGTGISH
jgi:hypothetical protein